MGEIKKSNVWEKAKRHALTIEQQTAFMKYTAESPVYSHWLPLFIVLLGTGCRIGEALGLRWQDLDFENRIISINHNLVYRIITNHFLDGNINIDRNMPYEEKISFYFSDYEEGVKIEREIGIKVFCGVELSYYGTDFLIYGLDKAWYLKNPQIMEMEKTEELRFMMESGALVIQAHPYREAPYIDHIRLFPRCDHGVEVINGCGTDFENHMAKLYAENYGLIESAGSDNHKAGNQKQLAGLCCDEPISDEHDFINRMKNGQMKLFSFCIDDNK